MRVKTSAIILSLLLASGGFTQSFAQRTVRFGVAAGAAIPVGSFQDRTKTGPGWLLTMTAGSNTSFLGFRIDLSDYTLGGRQFNGVDNSSVHVTAATANVVASVPVFRYVKPYAIAGIGVHPFKADHKRKYNFGINAGTGMTFPLPVGSGFFEARYHRIYRKDVAQRYIPIHLGVMF